jgi:hypothetical protein
MFNFELRSADRVPTRAIALFLLASLVAPAQAAIQFEGAGTLAYAFDSIAGEAGATSLSDDLVSNASVGESSANSDLVSGFGQLYTADPPGDTGVGGGVAQLGFRFSLRNTGLAPVTFKRGSVAVDVDAASRRRPWRASRSRVRRKAAARAWSRIISTARSFPASSFSTTRLTASESASSRCFFSPPTSLISAFISANSRLHPTRAPISSSPSSGA